MCVFYEVISIRLQSKLKLLIMKRKLIAVCMIACVFVACEKEELQPNVPTPVSEEQITDVPEPAAIGPNKKKRAKCCIYNKAGALLAEGLRCTGEGEDCNRLDRCVTPFGIDNAEEVIFEEMTRKEFCELWNTDDGMVYLQSKGVYAKDVK